MVFAGGETDGGQTILFGVRPCDARSFTLLDMLFDQEKYQDPYYINKRNQTTVVAVACVHPPYLTCFCTYLCPTCHCFDISDEVKGNDGIRIRNWDSCMFPMFTKETSGHNPRPSQKERWRQRVMHKFRYYVDNFNAIACVGCGRCVMACPVNLDIRKVVADIAKL